MSSFLWQDWLHHEPKVHARSLPGLVGRSVAGDLPGRKARIFRSTVWLLTWLLSLPMHLSSGFSLGLLSRVPYVKSKFVWAESSARPVRTQYDSRPVGGGTATFAAAQTKRDRPAWSLDDP